MLKALLVAAAAVLVLPTVTVSADAAPKKEKSDTAAKPKKMTPGECSAAVRASGRFWDPQGQQMAYQRCMRGGPGAI